MPDPSPSGERRPLERLRGDEAALELQLAEARRAAVEVVATARGEAERIIGEARAALELELARYRADTEVEAAREAAAARDAAAAEVAAISRRAEQNRPRALARLVEIVLGRALP